MEFFRTIEINTTEKIIQEQLSLQNLEKCSTLLFPLDEPSEEKSFIGGMWGEFTLTRQIIKGGVRFALLECPNALCWTVTTGYAPAKDSVVVHLTINRTQKQPEFIEEINEFLEDYQNCTEKFLNKM